MTDTSPPIGPLIGPEQLAVLLDGPEANNDNDNSRSVVVCDVRFSLADHDKGRRDYDQAHLPGARFVDLHGELSDQSVIGRGRHPLPTTQAFAATLGHLGIEPSSLVVAYDDAGGAIAARLWWMLRAVGHQRVAVLDGGIAAWQAAGLPLTDEVPDPPAKTPPYPVPDEWPGTVTSDEVAAASATVVDSRSPDRYRGDTEPIDPRAGHIPHAVNRFHGDNIGADGRHRPTDELAARFADVGEHPIVYCGSGVTACHNLLAMSVAGIDGARLYPGSWSEWSSDERRPVAAGDE